MTHPCQTCKHFQPKPFFSLRKNRCKKYPSITPTVRCINFKGQANERSESSGNNPVRSDSRSGL